MNFTSFKKNPINNPSQNFLQVDPTQSTVRTVGCVFSQAAVTILIAPGSLPDDVLGKRSP